MVQHSLLQNLLLPTNFEQVAGEVHLVQVIMDPAQSLTDQQLHWRTHWGGAGQQAEVVQREKEKTEGQRQRDQGSTSGWFLIGANYDVPMTTGQVLTVAGEGHRLLRL